MFDCTGIERIKENAAFIYNRNDLNIVSIHSVSTNLKKKQPFYTIFDKKQFI